MRHRRDSRTGKVESLLVEVRNPAGHHCPGSRQRRCIAKNRPTVVLLLKDFGQASPSVTTECGAATSNRRHFVRGPRARRRGFDDVYINRPIGTPRGPGSIIVSLLHAAGDSDRPTTPEGKPSGRLDWARGQGALWQYGPQRGGYERGRECTTVHDGQTTSKRTDLGRRLWPAPPVRRPCWAPPELTSVTVRLWPVAGSSLAASAPAASRPLLAQALRARPAQPGH